MKEERYNYFLEQWNKLDDNDKLDLFKEYCIENNCDDEFYIFEEHFFETFYRNDVIGAVRATCFGKVNWMDEYIRINVYGNLESLNKYEVVECADCYTVEIYEWDGFSNYIDMSGFEKKELVRQLESKIPNLSDYYTEEEAIEILDNIPDLTSENMAPLFMDEVWDTPLRRCSRCGNLMDEGYMLGHQYACSDECRNFLYDPNDEENARRLYLIDCYMIEPEEVEGMSADEIEEKYEDYEISDDVMYTIWV